MNRAQDWVTSRASHALKRSSGPVVELDEDEEESEEEEFDEESEEEEFDEESDERSRSRPRGPA